MTVIVIKEPSIFLLKDKSYTKLKDQNEHVRHNVKAYVAEGKQLKLDGLITK